jgi:capsular exopolysaccharide synthesis family protein
VNGHRGYVGAYASPFQLAKQADTEVKLSKNGKIEGSFSRSMAKSKGEMTTPEHAEEKKELILSHHPLSVISESYRSLRVAILLSKAEETPRSLLFTSSASSEGKTATTVNMAIVFAQMGVKVLVIDGDLRRPRCYKMLNSVKKGPGLTEVLTGQRDLQEVIQPTPVDNLSFLSSGAIPPNPAELVSSKKMQEALTELQRNYDYIFLDTPPVMPVSDALLLATLVDGVILVVNGQETPKHLVKEACTRLHHARAKILGVVLNKIDMDRGDYRYYYGRYYSHYHPEKQEEMTM